MRRFCLASVLFLLLVGGWAWRHVTLRAVPWPSAVPADKGVDAAALDRLMTKLVATGTRGFVLVRDGALIGETYGDRLRDPLIGRLRIYGTASMGKAVIGGLLTAVLQCKGLIALDQPAAQLISAWEHKPVRSRITLRQLATHSSGLAAASNGDVTPWVRRYRDQPAVRPEIAVHLAPMTFPPGRGFTYSNPGFSALGVALASAWHAHAGQSLADLYRGRILEGLNLPRESWRLSYDEVFEFEGVPVIEVGGGGAFTGRGLARLGQMVLEHGRWRGRQLIGRQCVDEMLTYRGTPLPADWRRNRMPAPALGWWTNANGAWPKAPADTYVAAGAEHQLLIVIPSLRLVAVRFGTQLGRQSFGGDFWLAFERELLLPLLDTIKDEGSAVIVTGS